jgi:hypothetical protein
MRSKKLVRQKSNSKRLNKFRKSQKLNRKSKSLRQNRKTIKGKRSRSIRRKTMRGGSGNQLQKQTQKLEPKQIQRFKLKRRMLEYALTLEELKPLLKDNGTRNETDSFLQTFFDSLPENLSEATPEQKSQLDALVEVHRFPLIRIVRQGTVQENFGFAYQVGETITNRIAKKDRFYFTLNVSTLIPSHIFKYFIKKGKLPSTNLFKQVAPDGTTKYGNTDSILKIFGDDTASNETVVATGEEEGVDYEDLNDVVDDLKRLLPEE